MDKKFLMGVIAVVLLFSIAGCEKLACPPGCTPEAKEPGLKEITGGILIPPTVQEPSEEKEISEIEAKADIVATEGELVKISPKATDPEGDKLTFIFSRPFNDKGEWQTKAGDAGLYKTTVVVSDGSNEVSREISIFIQSKNKAPVLKSIADITVKEGESVTISPVATDPDGDIVKLSYSGWMSKSMYTTNFNDAGTHVVKVTASDGKISVAQDVKVIVTNVNRAPVLEKIDDIVLKEDDVVLLDIKASDPDNDKLTITYSEPLNDEGAWVTEVGDAGIYNTKVTVSDGEDEASQEFKIVVEKLNRAPVIEKINDITLDEGETITIVPEVSDPDGDPITVTYSGWMTTSTYKTNYNDAGEHVVKVTASDGKNEVFQDIKVTVKNVNRAPVFTEI